jgi:hypothetical protein
MEYGLKDPSLFPIGLSGATFSPTVPVQLAQVKSKSMITIFNSTRSPKSMPDFNESDIACYYIAKYSVL